MYDNCNTKQVWRKKPKKKKTSVKRSARLRTSPLFVAGQEIVI